jgi:type II secretory pathway component PulF
MKTIQPRLAGTVALLSAFVLSGVIYLVYVLPKTMVVWADEARSLPVAKRLLIEISQICSSFGLLLVPGLMLVVIGCGIWAVRAGVANKREAANN